MRTLRLTSPLTTGRDVRVVQANLNAHLKRWGIGKLAVDGGWGPTTQAAYERVAYLLGLPTEAIKKGATEYTRNLIANEGERNMTQRKRARARMERFRDAREKGPAAVIEAARRHVGETEKPAGSNRGPGIISKCQKAMLGYDGYFWCGAFVGYFLRNTAGIPISKTRIVYTPAIVADARARLNGFEGWHKVADAESGDLALFDWESGGPIANHVELVIRNLGGGRLLCVGGNTSKGGTDNNGGGVYEQQRDRGLIGVARPRYHN